MGEPAKNQQIATEWESKKVGITGLTKNQRLKALEAKKQKMAAKGWEYVEYNDQGMSKSEAVFRKPLSKSELGGLHKAIGIGGVVAVLAIIGSLVDTGTPESNVSAPTIKTQASPARPAKQESDLPLVDKSATKMAVDTIKDYPGLIDAAVVQSDDRQTLELVVIVAPSVSLEQGKEYGDNFVRQVKTLLKDGPFPGKEIGNTLYSYRITVARPDESVIATGAKVAPAKHITW